MSIPKYHEMYRPVLEFLSDGKIHSLKEIKKYVKDYFNLTDEDVAELLESKLQTVFNNRVGWARTFLKKAGVIVSPARAMFQITNDGYKLLKDNNAVINDKCLLQFDAFKQFYYGKKNDSNKNLIDNNQSSEDTPEDIIENAYKTIYDSLAEDLIEEVLKLSPFAFEKFVLDLMYKMGYGAVKSSSKTTSKAKDKGIDGIIMEDKLGFNLIYVQAKQYSNNPVGRPEVQAFFGAIADKKGKGLFVTTSKFTKDAIEFAENAHIILIDGKKLVDYMIEYNFGVSVKQTYEIKSIDSDLFNGYDL